MVSQSTSADATPDLQRRRRNLRSFTVSRSVLKVTATQLAIVAGVLLAWQYLPQINALSSRSHLFDPFFISSPEKIYNQLVLLFGPKTEDGGGAIWHYLWPTVTSALTGMMIGLVTGSIAGILLGSSRYWSRVLNPFAVAMNAVPRIALIPVIVVIFGPTRTASVVVSVIVVFFIVFFNAYEGAKSPPEALIQNAQLMGGTTFQITRRIRAPFALVWTLASLPVVATFSMISVVTAEILTGYPGLGRLITVASSTADATLTFAVVVVLAVLGLIIVGVTSLFKRRVLHWWTEGRD
jgi:NitT/TauT family transport system permease protein